MKKASSKKEYDFYHWKNPYHFGIAIILWVIYCVVYTKTISWIYGYPHDEDGSFASKLMIVAILLIPAVPYFLTRLTFKQARKLGFQPILTQVGDLSQFDPEFNRYSSVYSNIMYTLYGKTGSPGAIVGFFVIIINVIWMIAKILRLDILWNAIKRVIK